MVQFYDGEKGLKKPIDLFKFLLSGEYDQGDVALISYDDVYDLLHDEGRRQSLKEALSDAYEKATKPSLKNLAHELPQPQA